MPLPRLSGTPVPSRLGGSAVSRLRQGSVDKDPKTWVHWNGSWMPSQLLQVQGPRPSPLAPVVVDRVRGVHPPIPRVGKLDGLCAPVSRRNVPWSTAGFDRSFDSVDRRPGAERSPADQGRPGVQSTLARGPRRSGSTGRAARDRSPGIRSLRSSGASIASIERQGGVWIGPNWSISLVSG
jgi:hypothetical protein